jgi:hypothetical protein
MSDLIARAMAIAINSRNVFIESSFVVPHVGGSLPSVILLDIPEAPWMRPTQMPMELLQPSAHRSQTERMSAAHRRPYRVYLGALVRW